MTNLEIYLKAVNLNNTVDKALDHIIRVFNTHRIMVALKAESLSLTQQWESPAFQEIFIKRLSLTNPLSSALDAGHLASELLALLRVVLFLDIVDKSPKLKHPTEITPLNWGTSDSTYNNAKQYLTKARHFSQEALTEARKIYLTLLTQSNYFNEPEDIPTVMEKERKVYNAYEVLVSINMFSQKCQELLVSIPHINLEKHIPNPKYTPELLDDCLGESIANSLEKLKPGEAEIPPPPKE